MKKEDLFNTKIKGTETEIIEVQKELFKLGINWAGCGENSNEIHRNINYLYIDYSGDLLLDNYSLLQEEFFNEQPEREIKPEDILKKSFKEKVVGDKYEESYKT